MFISDGLIWLKSIVWAMLVWGLLVWGVLVWNMLIRGMFVRGVDRSVDAAVNIGLAGCARAMRQCLAVHARAACIVKLVDGAFLVAASARSAVHS